MCRVNCAARRPPAESGSASNVSLRTKSREFAMQMLFQWDMSEQEPAKLEAKFWRAAKATESTRAFANRLFEGAVKDTSAIDELIVKQAENWRLERLAVIDRAILRLGGCGTRATGCPPEGVSYA